MIVLLGKQRPHGWQSQERLAKACQEEWIIGCQDSVSC